MVTPVQILRLLMAASQGDIQALEQTFLSGSDMDCADYDNRWVSSV